METKQIGTVNVDSGKLIITDPLYLNSWETPPLQSSDESEFGYHNIDKALKSTLQHGSKFGVNNNGRGFSVDCNDGEYPVMAETNGDVLSRIWIDFTA